MNPWIWIGGLFAYLLVGGLLLMWMSRFHPDFVPNPIIGGVALLVGWPVVLGAWFLLRGPVPLASTPAEPPQPGGKVGIAVGDLRPWGMVEIDGRRFEARAEAGMIAAGERVEVVGRDGRGLVVRTQGSGSV